MYELFVCLFFVERTLAQFFRLWKPMVFVYVLAVLRKKVRKKIQFWYEFLYRLLFYSKVRTILVHCNYMKSVAMNIFYNFRM